MKTSAALGLLGTALFMVGPAQADGIHSPGKDSAAVTTTADLMTSPFVSVEVQKGRKKRMLLVAATVRTSVVGLVDFEWEVNGVGLDDFSHQCSGQCAVTGTSWLDLDAAELANPGAFINVPLVISAEASTNVSAPGSVMSLTATLVKK